MHDDTQQNKRVVINSNQRAGRMSLLGPSQISFNLNSVPSSFAPAPKKGLVIVARPSNSIYRAPPPAYIQSDYPGLYVAKSLNLVTNLRTQKLVSYVMD